MEVHNNWEGQQYSSLLQTLFNGFHLSPSRLRIIDLKKEKNRTPSNLDSSINFN